MLSETAINFLRAVDRQADELGKSTSLQERGFANLGYAILEVSELQYWRVHFETFREYLKDLAPRCGRSAGQLQQYFLTVRDLSDTFNQEQLQRIGITKAIQLRNAKDYAIVLPAKVIEAALSPMISSKELKQVISTELKMPKEEEGDWMDLEMEFMVSPEERSLIEATLRSVKRSDPVIKDTISKSAQMKESILRLCMEWGGAHLVDGE